MSDSKRKQLLDNCYPTGTEVYTRATRVSIPRLWIGPVDPDNEGIAGLPRRLFAARSLLRARRGVPVTQGMVAELVGVTEGQIGHWERGRMLPDLSMIELLAAALEVSPVWLAYGVVPAESTGPRRLTEEEIAAARARVAARRAVEPPPATPRRVRPAVVPQPPPPPEPRDPPQTQAPPIEASGGGGANGPANGPTNGPRNGPTNGPGNGPESSGHQRPKRRPPKRR